MEIAHIDGLDPEVAALLVALTEVAPAIGQAPPVALRQGFSNLMSLLHPEQRGSFPGRIVDEVISWDEHHVPVRSYEPAGVTHSDVVVFIHGGGWVLGDKDSAEPSAAAIATMLGVRVVSVDYRLAPEHQYPAAYLDCLAVARAVASEHPRWMGIAGDSAGGNLAAAVALTAPVHGFGVDAQLLFYPAIDPAMGSSSYAEFAEGYLLTESAMSYYWQAYRGDTDGTDPTFALSRATRFVDFPPTVIATAGFDPLRDEGVDFASRLVSSGVPTTYLPFPSLIHGWLDQTDRIHAAAIARDHTIAAFADLRSRQLAR
jgi:acetyl esterase